MEPEIAIVDGGNTIDTRDQAAIIVKEIRASAPELCHLKLNGDTLGKDAVKAIVEAIMQCPKLKSIDMVSIDPYPMQHLKRRFKSLGCSALILA